VKDGQYYTCAGQFCNKFYDRRIPEALTE